MVNHIQLFINSFEIRLLFYFIQNIYNFSIEQNKNKTIISAIEGKPVAHLLER